MDYKTVTEQFAVAPQISLDDISTIKQLGYVAIINNRPDGEVEEQPTAAQMAKAAQEAGLQYYHIPIISGTMPDEAIAKTKSVLENIEGPTFAYCRSGTRSICLWAISKPSGMEGSDILGAVSNAGYDLPFLASHLQD